MRERDILPYFPAPRRVRPSGKPQNGRNAKKAKNDSAPLARTGADMVKYAAFNGEIAQLVERRTHKPKVKGSIPFLATILRCKVRFGFESAVAPTGELL